MNRLFDTRHEYGSGSIAIHWLVAGVTLVLLLHVAGAIKRQLMNRDGTLMRMIRPRRAVHGLGE